MRKAPNGSGTQPILRKDGRWQAKYTAGIDKGTGKPIRRNVYGKTQQECVQKLREVTAKLDSGSYKEPCKMKLSQWVEIWLNEYLEDIKYSTEKTYRDHFNNYIIPALGYCRLDAIHPHDVQMFINSVAKKVSTKTGKQLSAKTVKNIHGTISKCLSEAVRVGYIPSNPCHGTKLPKIEKTEIKPLERSEMKLFEQAFTGTKYAHVFFILMYTGVRLGECLGLRWSNINFERRMITISGQVTVHRDSEHPRAYGETKNGKTRTIPVSKDVIEELKKVRLEQKKLKLMNGKNWYSDIKDRRGKTITDLCFTNEYGNALIHATIDEHFQRIMHGIGLYGYRVHDLRHSFATECIRMGIDIETLSKVILGHSDVSITLNRYSHSTNEMQLIAQQKLDEARAMIKSM